MKYFLLALFSSITLTVSSQKQENGKLQNFLSKTTVDFEMRQSIMSNKKSQNLTRGLLGINYNYKSLRYTLQGGEYLILNNANNTYQSYFGSGIEFGYSFNATRISLEPYLGIGLASNSNNQNTDSFTHYDVGVSFINKALPYIALGTGVSKISFYNESIDNAFQWFLSIKVNLSLLKE